MTLCPSATVSTKILPGHLARKAIVYIRQSSAKQVRDHWGSQVNQRALVERANQLGWPPDRIEVLDGDLGQSAATPQTRATFQALVAAVALGHVGIVLGWEVSRLARNNADWYHLLDLATLMDTLIADADGVYDPRLHNDRLLLGLKGTLSEAELYLLHQRLNAGRLSKVRQGQYVQHLPTGLIRLPDKRVQKDPDVQIRHSIELVFAKFTELKSCQQVLRYFKQQGLLLPRRQHCGVHRGEVLWRQPAAAIVYEVLKNPAYAGAFVHGRRPTKLPRQGTGPSTRGTLRQPLADWNCIIQDAYPAYITWDQFLANQAQLYDNYQHAQNGAATRRGAAREGTALLQGIATCGQCGRVMRVVYKPRRRYICDSLTRAFAESSCAHLDGASVEAFVVTAFFEALQPAQLDALEAVLATRDRERQRLQQWHQQQIQRATYEAQLAQRRYAAVDPANRLVAAELERQWEASLLVLQQAQEAADRFTQQPLAPALSPELRARLQHIGQNLPSLWASEHLTNAHRKQLLRSLIARVILTRTAPDRVQVKIVWVSGHFSEGTVIPPILRQAEVSGYPQLVARVQSLWQQGQTDSQIAQTLTAEGFRSARSPRLSPATVLKIRRQHHWLSRYHAHRLASKVEGMWTVHGLAAELGVDRNWFYYRIARGKLSAPDVIQCHPYGTYLIRDDPVLLEQLHREAQQTRHSHVNSPS